MNSFSIRRRMVEIADLVCDTCLCVLIPRGVLKDGGTKVFSCNCPGKKFYICPNCGKQHRLSAIVCCARQRRKDRNSR